MENRINIAELLKDCPTGMELDCKVFDAKVIYQGLNKRIPTHPIVVQTEHGFEFELTQYGQIHNIVGSKCIIFPKGKTTWEGFVPPCQFEDGDVITCTNSACSFVAIFKKMNTDTTFRRYVSLTLDDVQQFCTKESWSDFCNPRLATEEEKQKLFDVIKENGYCWNAETKTLEKIEPNFKVGDRIRHKEETKWTCLIKRIDDKYWVDGHPTCYTIPFGEQDEYELLPNKFDINTLKPFESKVLVRYNKDKKWCGSFFSFIDRDLQSYCYKFVTTAEKSYPMMIPYKGNEFLLGTTDDCKDFYKTWEL